MENSGVDWAAMGRGGNRLLATPTLVVLLFGWTAVVLLLLVTIGLSGPGAWVLRVVALLLGVPVVLLSIRRASVLRRLGVMEETGEHPDNVIQTTTADGQEIAVIVPGAEQSVMPRLGLGALTGYSLAVLVSGGLALFLLLIVGISRLVTGA